MTDICRLTCLRTMSCLDVSGRERLQLRLNVFMFRSAGKDSYPDSLNHSVFLGLKREQGKLVHIHVILFTGHLLGQRCQADSIVMGVRRTRVYWCTISLTVEAVTRQELGVVGAGLNRSESYPSTTSADDYGQGSWSPVDIASFDPRGGYFLGGCFRSTDLSMPIQILVEADRALWNADQFPIVDATHDSTLNPKMWANS